MSLYIAVLHHPVYNRHGDIVTTAIANMDIHDIARAAATYGVKFFYIVNPMPEQKELAAELIRHWTQGYGASSNPARREAFKTVRLADSLAEVVAEVEKDAGDRPEIAVTGASIDSGLTPWGAFRERLGCGKVPFLVLFGTGWGIAKEIVERADYRLEPLAGPSQYNHLSVRSAVSITLDRLMGINRPG